MAAVAVTPSTRPPLVTSLPFCSAVPAGCQTLLVRRPSLDARGPLGNRADDSVEQYTYDHVLVNDGDLDCLRECVLDFLQGQFAAQEDGADAVPQAL